MSNNLKTVKLEDAAVLSNNTLKAKRPVNDVTTRVDPYERRKKSKKRKPRNKSS
jgi:divalent metal cation (Fe/Co/Zn/Cd) transporter